MGLSQIASKRSRNSEDILPYVERFFIQVSDRFRSRNVNRSANDIPTRVATVDASVAYGDIFATQNRRIGEAKRKLYM